MRLKLNSKAYLFSILWIGFLLLIHSSPAAGAKLAGDESVTPAAPALRNLLKDPHR